MDPTVNAGFNENVQMAKKLWDDHFCWTVRIMKISFLYPLQNKTVQILGNLTLCSLLIISLLVTVLKLAKEKENGIKGTTLVEIIIQLVGEIVMAFCYLFMIGSKKNIYRSVILMAQMWFDNTEEVKEMMTKLARRAYYFSTFQTGSILLLCVSLGIAPVAIPTFLTWALPGNQTYEKTLPLHTEFFVDENEYFYHILAAQVFGLFIYGLLIGAMNHFQCCAVMYIIVEIRCLQYNFERISEEYNCKIAINEKNANIWIYEQLKDFVRTHQICIDFFGIIQEMSTLLMFVVLIACFSMAILTATAMIILVETDFIGAAKMLLVFCITMCAIIFVCIPSQLLKIMSEDFYITSFGMNGQIHSLKVQKILLFIIMRSKKPFVLTAGPTIELNFETCSSIIKTSISYAAAFRSLYTAL